MLQQVVAVSMIGRALVLFFNLIPWAREGKKRKYHHESLFQLGYLLAPLLMRNSDRRSKPNKNPTLMCRDPESSRWCLGALNTQTSPCVFPGALRREKQLSYASGTKQEQSPNSGKTCKALLKRGSTAYCINLGLFSSSNIDHWGKNPQYFPVLSSV